MPRAIQTSSCSDDPGSDAGESGSLTLGFLVSLVKEFKYGLKWKPFYWCKAPEQAGCKTSAAAWRRQKRKRRGKALPFVLA